MFDKDLQEQVVALFIRIVHEVEYKLHRADAPNRVKEKMVIQAPEFLLRIFFEGLKQYNPVVLHYYKAGESFKYRGLLVRPGYEMAIVIFHEDYPIYQNSWMLTKIPLHPAQTIERKEYTETIIKISEVFGLPTKNPQDN